MTASKMISLSQDLTCPSRGLLRVVGDRWSLLILLQLESGTRRTSELRRSIGDISAKVLTDSLRKLEELGFIRRRIRAKSPPHVEYCLTQLGRELATVVVGLDKWVGKNLERVNRAKAKYARQTKSRVPWHTPRVA
jgi:DNA-binding HxlR family transcriptional regulator